MNDGVKVVKSIDTRTNKLAPSKSIFDLISTAKSGKNAAVTKYSGEKSIKIIGKGSATIDFNYVEGAVAVVVGHNYNLTIEGVAFKNMIGGNFIKIGGSSKVYIKKNTFMSHKATDSSNNEAISIEVPDSKSKSFSYP